MLRRADFLLQEAERVEAIGLTLADGSETKLKIAVDEIFPQEILYQVLDRVSEQFPLLRVELMESVLRGATELLEKTDVDIAVSPVVVKDLFNEELCQIDFIAVANPYHSLHSYDRKLTLEDLKSHRLIVVRDSALSQQKDEGWLEANQRWTVSHMKTSVDMIKKGFGFAWLPKYLIASELEEGLLKPLALDVNGGRKTSLYLLFGDADALGPAARCFLGELRYQCLGLSDA